MFAVPLFFCSGFAFSENFVTYFSCFLLLFSSYFDSSVFIQPFGELFLTLLSNVCLLYANPLIILVSVFAWPQCYSKLRVSENRRESNVLGH